MKTASLRGNRDFFRLVLLAVVTLVAVVAAIIVVANDSSSVRTSFVPHPLFEGLADNLDQVERIVYTASQGLSGETKIVMLRDEKGIWRSEARGGYPLNVDLVRKALLGVGEMEAYEPRTASPDWHRNLGLLAPEDIGSAIRVEFFDATENRVAALLVGKIPERAVDVKGEGLIYVRRDGEDQAWLARGRMPVFKTIMEWLDPAFVDIARDDVARVVLWADTERPVILSRASRSDTDFVIENIPENYITRGAPVVNQAATSLLNTAFDDVVPADTLDLPEDGPKVVVETFDGLRLSMLMGGHSGALWGKFTVELDETLAGEGADLEKGRADADRLSARLDGWVYKLPQETGGQVTQTMDVLIHAGGQHLPD